MSSDDRVPNADGDALSAPAEDALAPANDGGSIPPERASDDTLDSHDDPEVDAFLREVAAAPAVSPPGALIGATLGRYRVRSVLGRGAMGVVYLAEDESLRRLVAVKVMRAVSIEARVRLKREARCCAAISHPGVAQVYEIGETDDQVYIVIEYIEGLSLRRLLDREGPIPAERASAIFTRVLEAVAAAHAGGVVHRDVKPENIMITAGDAVKVLDFGLATWIDAVWPTNGLPHTLTQSVAGMIAGTPGYMAPEQALGHRVDARADVFSLGVIAHELFAGARPFGGASAIAILMSTLNDEVVVPKEVPIAGLISRCLSKKPEDRFADAGELLETFRGDAPARRDARRKRSRARRRDLRAIAVAGVAALFAGGAALAWTRGHRAVTPPPSMTMAMAMAFADMVQIPAGTFAYGKTREQLDSECTALGADCLRRSLDWEQPRQEVRVSSFFMDKYEVDNEQFASFLNSLGSEIALIPDASKPGRRFVRYLPTAKNLVELYESSGVVDGPRFTARDGYARKPVVWVTWEGAKLYCTRAGRRLPREAEWEYAARGSDARPFAWGDAEPSCRTVVFGRDEGRRCEGLPRRPEDIGSAPQDVTPLGLHDLGGNVGEWVEDAFSVPFHPSCGSCVDPVTSPSNEEDMRVVRGGGWGSVQWVRTTARFKMKQTIGGDDVGFRCALSTGT